MDPSVIDSKNASSGEKSEDPFRLEFPRGGTVPFPYDEPYPQQIALMDTLLQCLHRKEQDMKKSEKEDCATKKKPRAAVMMLESPTGTGKSLSLACSAMAWLRYCEQRDLTVSSSNENNNKHQTNGHKSPPAVDDWWNAWVPPDEAEKERAIQTTQRTAKQARHELREELDLWRSKLYGDNPDSERAHERRKNLVRSAVTTAKLAERVERKKRTKSTNQQQTSNTAAVAQIMKKEEDFCLANYRSDPEDICNDTDSDGEEGATNNSDTIDAGKATTLLDGRRLDGSFRHRGPMSERSVGQVRPGTGVRKIIYAARTHSQLSQFVRELKRTAWGTTTRVVALGSRQLLCGNTALKRSHPTEASLTEACLDLKQGKSGVIKNGDRKRGKEGSEKSCSCSLLESKEAVSTLGLHLLTTPSDIEDAAGLGSASHTCAYYASRVSALILYFILSHLPCHCPYGRPISF